MATLGLIAFRSGVPALGRKYYDLSIAWFSQVKERGSVASAILYRLREEIRIDGSSIPHWMDMAQRIAKSPEVVRLPEVVGMAELVLEESRAAAKGSPVSKVRAVEAPASPEDFSHYASLFHVPEEAKQLALRFGNFSEPR
jgi:hypothetical protein